jgi:hypothetical protein
MGKEQGPLMPLEFADTMERRALAEARQRREHLHASQFEAGAHLALAEELAPPLLRKARAPEAHPETTRSDRLPGQEIDPPMCGFWRQ